MSKLRTIQEITDALSVLDEAVADCPSAFTIRLAREILRWVVMEKSSFSSVLIGLHHIRSMKRATTPEEKQSAAEAALDNIISKLVILSSERYL